MPKGIHEKACIGSLVPRDYVSMVVYPKLACCEKCDWGLARTKVLSILGNKQVFPIEEIAVNMIDDAGGSVVRKGTRPSI